MSAPRGNNADASLRFWPPHEPPDDAVAVETTCARCDQPWRIHRDLSGYRLRCICSGWVRVPYPEALLRSARASAVALEERRVTPLAPSRKPQSGADPRKQEPTTPHAREIDHGLLELVAIGIAFIAPPTIAILALGPDSFERWLPFTSVMGGALVLLVGLASGEFRFGELRGARSRFFIESIVVTVFAVGLAAGMRLLIQSTSGEFPDLLRSVVTTLGVPLALFTVALCPAVFEEIAFRGIVQGRLITLLGTPSGILITAVLFTLAHGLSVVSPLHFLLGLYLGTLRLRSGSLFPGMIFHGLYNGTIVMLAA